MIGTRRLCQALGRVLGRTLGKHTSSDEEEALQHQRPIASTSSQRAAVAVAKDVGDTDNATVKPYKEPHNPATEDVVGDSHGFPNGHQDTSMLTDYAYHVASTRRVVNANIIHSL